MTREEAKKLSPIIQAFADGKVVQFLGSCGKWFDVGDMVEFACAPNRYRIKPEPKYRPFKDVDECWNEMKKHDPFGYVKSKCDGSYNHYKLITKVSHSGTIGKADDCAIEFNDDTLCYHDMVNLYDNYTFADGTPFGIKEG